jgi:hypothetical protein
MRKSAIAQVEKAGSAIEESAAPSANSKADKGNKADASKADDKASDDGKAEKK